MNKQQNPKPSGSPNGKGGKRPPYGGVVFGTFLFILCFLLSVIIIGMYMPASVVEEEYVTFPEFKNLVEENIEEKDITIHQYSEGKVTLIIQDKVEENEKTEATEEAKTEENQAAEREIYYTKVNPLKNGVSSLVEKYDIDYDFIVPKNVVGNILNILFYVILISILLYVFVPMMRNRGLTTSKVDTKKSNIPHVTFDDIGGLSNEAKAEVLQIQTLLQKPKEAKKLGLKPPKGILLYGPSGTGKTLIAKALAHAWNANFLAAEGSSFVEMFAGMGAKRVRDLFQQAQKTKPAVIFIDEIDAVGKKRSANGHFSNDEREQTLNQLLVCLDGIESNEDVFVIAATNRLDVLDEALLRPGRFDYKIMIDLPDVEGRKEIIRIHTKNKPLAEEVQNQIDDIAHSTAGYSGADIESLFHKAAFHAFSEGRYEITMEDVNYAIDRIIIGNAGRGISNNETKERVAYHEAGHAAITSLLNPNSIRKATIIPRGQALGYVAQVPKEGLLTEKELRHHLCIMVAGGVAEKIVYNTHSMGVADDFKKAKELIEKMVEEWGMGKTSLIPSFAEEDKHKQMERLYKDVLFETEELLKKHYSFFEAVANLLLEKETVDGKEIEALKEQHHSPNGTIENRVEGKVK